MTELSSDYLHVPTPAQQVLLNTMLDIRIPPPTREEAGRQLAMLGDPRRGVGVLPNGVPDIVWCEVPGTDQGRPPVPFGGDNDVPPENALPAQMIELNTFWMAKYPITYRQYQAFIDDKGYATPDWWEGLEKPTPKAQQFKFGNHPRETVDWFEAMAFCRWLSAKMGAEIRLPTEEEWEKAARGEQGWFYPWGNEYESGRANIKEKEQKVGPYHIKSTTAVGLYPHSASPYGVLDMAGNVWNWTVTAWETEHREAEQTQGLLVREPYTERVKHGGSWRRSHIHARAAYRVGSSQNHRLKNSGFRVCMASAPHTPL